jgi:hypothetical protein
MWKEGVEEVMVLLLGLGLQLQPRTRVNMLVDGACFVCENKNGVSLQMLKMLRSNWTSQLNDYAAVTQRAEFLRTIMDSSEADNVSQLEFVSQVQTLEHAPGPKECSSTRSTFL